MFPWLLDTMQSGFWSTLKDGWYVEDSGPSARCGSQIRIAVNPTKIHSTRAPAPLCPQQVKALILVPILDHAFRCPPSRSCSSFTVTASHKALCSVGPPSPRPSDHRQCVAFSFIPNRFRPQINMCFSAKKYTAEHESVAFDDATGLGTVTITDFAQKSLGDVVFVDLPDVGSKFSKGGEYHVTQFGV